MKGIQPFLWSYLPGYEKYLSKSQKGVWKTQKSCLKLLPWIVEEQNIQQKKTNPFNKWISQLWARHHVSILFHWFWQYVLGTSGTSFKKCLKSHIFCCCPSVFSSSVYSSLTCFVTIGFHEGIHDVTTCFTKFSESSSTGRSSKKIPPVPRCSCRAGK